MITPIIFAPTVCTLFIFWLVCYIMLVRKYARLDANHGAIVTALRQCGCTVQSLAAIGSGCPDLLVARNGQMWVLEVKDGNKPPSARQLTEDEKLWHLRWNAPVHVVNSPLEAIKVIQ